MNNGFDIPQYVLPVFSAADDAGISTGGSKNTLVDRNKYWTPGIWQGALVIISINDQIHTTIITNNTEQSLSFPEFPSNEIVTKNSYCIKRLAPSVYRPGIILTATQQLVELVYTPQDLVVVPTVFPWIQANLAPGANHSLYDMTSGALMPYLVPAGYILTVIEQRMQFNQDWDAWIFADGFLVASPGGAKGGDMIDQSNIVKFSTSQVDPTAASAHLIDYQVYNRGLASSRGGITVSCILEAVNTPPFPGTKGAHCPYCSGVTEVPVTATVVTCSTCGKNFRVFAVRRGPYRT